MTGSKNIPVSARRLSVDADRGRVERALDRYAEIVRRERVGRLFSEQEWQALRDMMDDGAAPVPADAISGMLWRRWNTGLQTGLAEKWNVDGDGMLNRLRLLSFVQEVAVIEDLEMLSQHRHDAA